MGCDRDTAWFENTGKSDRYPDGVEPSLVLARILNSLGDATVTWSVLMGEGEAAGLSRTEVLAGLTRLESAGKVKLDGETRQFIIFPTTY